MGNNKEMTSITIFEYVDLKRINQLLNSTGTWLNESKHESKINQSDETEKEKLKKLKRYVGKKGKHKAEFTLSKHHPVGRLYSEKITLKDIKKEARSFLVSGKCCEWDLKNANMSLLMNLCRHHDIPCPKLINFVENRKSHIESLTELGVESDKAKKIWNSLYMGAPFQPWLNTQGIEPPEFLPEFVAEMKLVRKRILELAVYQNHVAAGKKSNQNKNKLNPEGSAMSFVLADTERIVITLAVEEIQKMGYKVNSYIYDGLMVEGTEFPEEHLRALEQAIKDQLDFDVSFAIKQPEYSAEVLGVVETDNGEAEYSDTRLVLERMRLFCVENNIVRTNPNTGIRQKNPDYPYCAEIKYEKYSELINEFEIEIAINDPHIHSLKMNKNKQMRKEMEYYLENSVDVDFLFGKTDLNFVGYMDGVFNLTTQEFTPKKQLDYCPDFLVRKMFHVNFISNHPTPLWDAALSFQLPDDVVPFLCGMLGRLFFKVRQLDKFELVPILRGAAGSGKSTVIDTVQAMFDETSICTITKDSSDKFGLEGCDDKEIMIMADCSDEFHNKLGQQTFQGMISGESVVVNKKGIKQKHIHNWSVPLLMAMNRPLRYTDDGGSVTRRLLEFQWTKIIPEDQKDTELKTKISETESPYIFPKLIRAYHELVQLVNGRDAFMFMPESIKLEKEENKVNQNSLIYFLSLGKDDNKIWIQQKENNSVILKDFKNYYKKFCEFNPEHKFSWDDNCEGAVLRSVGFSITKNYVCKMCFKPFSRKTKCCPDHIPNDAGRCHKQLITNMIIHKKTEKQNFDPDFML